MANSFFQFKQFRIEQDRCAMKVSTDACILGASTGVDRATRILDIGTGTGLLALMLAQRSAARIDAVEIEAQAVQQAAENVQQSPWKDRIAVIHNSIQQFALQRSACYDLIVSNPPFFVNGFRSPHPQVNAARHADLLSFADLLHCVNRLISSEGSFTVLLPVYESQLLESQAAAYPLPVVQRLYIKDRPDKKAHRVITTYRRQPLAEVVEEELVIKEASGKYTTEFARLMSGFYL